MQNAAPNGPAVWLFTEATDRVMRHAANDWEWMRSIGLIRICNHMDQASLSDVCS